jgi:hypothetical protein
MKYLNLNFISKFTIPFFIFYLLFKKINSISGTETFDINGQVSDTEDNDEDDICPCDITEGQCDNGCICDKDCFDLMLSNDYFNNITIDESSYTEKNIDSKLDYCDEYKESVDDLYNPLILAFKILKRGFCIVKKNKRENEEGNTKEYDKTINDYELKRNDDENIINNENFPKYLNEDNVFNINSGSESNFLQLNISMPIALPNGLCLFHTHRLIKNKDYEVTCSYPISLRTNVFNEFNRNMNDFQIKNYSVQNNYYYIEQNPGENTSLKKVEIYYYDQGNNTGTINYFYEVTDTKVESYLDLTVEVKFLSNEADLKLSGNPGYIKGKQIILGTDNNVYNKGIVFPIEKNSNSNTEGTQTLYYDNYMDNKITFEDLIIYGYTSDNYITIFSGAFDNIKYAQFGNSKTFKVLNNKDNNNNNIVLIGEYKDSGVVNNTQFQIYDFGYAQQYPKIDAQNSYHYFIVKFIKLETDTEWYYAPGPVIIKLPRNIMYPFKIGTSKYS